MIGDLRFLNAWAVWLTPLLLVLVGLALVEMRRRQAMLNAFGELPLVSRFSRLGPDRLRGLRPLLRSLALIAVAVALAGPVLAAGDVNDGRRPLDVAVVLDVSRSMGAEDYASKTSRLGKARAMLLETLPDLAGARVGVVTFAGAAFPQAPLTEHHAALQYILSSWVFVESAPSGGSDLAGGIATAIRRLEWRRGDRIVFLFSDGGAEPVQDLRPLLAEARSKAIRIFTFGLGSPVASKVARYDGDGRFSGWVTVNGEIARTRLDDDVLREIAAGTEGAYARVVSGHELRQALGRLRISGSSTTAHPRQLFQWLLGGALVFLFLERVDGGPGQMWASVRAWARRIRSRKEPPATVRTSLDADDRSS